MTDSDLNVSLEKHLVDALLPLKDVLSGDLAAQLNVYVAETPPLSIPYSLLASISTWSRSQPGQTALHAHVPPLRPQDYSMIALLAGTTTSPERKFPLVVPRSVIEEKERKRQISDRKAITAVVNALLTIAGSGIATWFVAERWRYEWRVLLSFLVAVVVAFSEIVLFIIWQSRQSKKRTSRQHRSLPLQHRSNDAIEAISMDSDMYRASGDSVQREDQTLRFRALAGTHQGE